MAVLTLGACGDPDSPSVQRSPVRVSTTIRSSLDPVGSIAESLDPSSDRQFWQRFAIDANWVEYYSSISEMSVRADASVIATVGSVESAAPIKGDAPGSELEFVILHLDIIVDFSGSGATSVALRLETPQTKEGYDAFVKELSATLPSGPAYFALRSVDGGNTYRIINNVSVWIQMPSGLDTPMDPHFDQTRAVFADELAGLPTLQSLADYLDIRNAGG